MTELGVDEVVPWAASRSIVRWDGERGRRSHQRWVAIAAAAAKQSRRAWLPAIAPLASTAEVTVRVRRAAPALVLESTGAAALSSVPLPADGEVLVVVGPEGGIAEDELHAFAAAGAVACRLGPTILRSSTAGAAALAVLSDRLGKWA
jgi:16S rRNA (uracil1498-N3)-methyltransferase